MLFGVWCLGPGVWGSGFVSRVGVWGSRFRVQGSVFRVHGSGFRVSSGIGCSTAARCA